MISLIKLKYNRERTGSYYLTIGTVSSGYLFNTLSGFESPKARVSIVDRGNSHGATLNGNYYGRRTMVIEGEIWAYSIGNLNTKRQDLAEACGLHNGLREIIVTTKSGLEFAVDAIISADFSVPYKKGLVIFSEFRIELTAPFPFFKSSTVQEETVNPFSGGGGAIPSEIPFDMSTGGSGSATLTNSGNIFSYPIIILSGEIENPSILNETHGEMLSLLYSIPDGDSVTIDVYNRTAVLESSSANLLAYISGDWPLIYPGDNFFKLTGIDPNGNAKAEIRFQDSYLGT